VSISFILCILGIDIITTAIEEFQLGEKHEEPTSLISVVSFISFMVFEGFAVLKLHYVTIFYYIALYKDGLCSFVGTVLSLSLFIDTILAIWDPTKHPNYQLPKFEDNLFKLTRESHTCNGKHAFLIPMAEAPLTNLYRDTILKKIDLSLSFVFCVIDTLFSS
jgi:hypothetical protein